MGPKSNFTDLWIVFAPIVTGIGGWLVAKRRNAAETDGVVLANLKESVDVYTLIINNLRSEIKLLHQKIDDMEGKIDHLRIENEKLRAECLQAK